MRIPLKLTRSGAHLCSQRLNFKMVLLELHSRNPLGFPARPLMYALAGFMPKRLVGRSSTSSPKMGWRLRLAALSGLHCRLLQANQDEFSANAPSFAVS